ncbi:CLUMA_CG002343, isoform A [Clunio marinus]|uniref:CLUMA_CG002343, isoform A n=1 Tax=Clunio marinus TaxID=568069 RepID=A0A1J1HQ74_9DIPT|nr:CLUMA_CG002343, isoform A [Clunio marinus]
MKFLTVLLISITAFVCTAVTANPVQIKNNNVGDITAIKIDINGRITSVVNQDIINVIVALLEDTDHIPPTLPTRPEIPHLDDLIRHISRK